ncbi:MAG: DinB family protein [Chloroflexi bacterium]|nr:DinB family protein [Chloroflexota bacterium]
MRPEIEDLLEKMEAHRTELLAILEGLSNEAAERHPEGEWSAKQQVAHLVQAEPTWLGWARTVRDEPGATVGQTPDEGQVFLEDVDTADSHSLSWWLERLRETRAETLKGLDDMDLSSSEALGRAGRHRTFGDMNVLQFLRALYRHDRMHMEQLTGREQSFVPRRASGGIG